MERLDRDGKGIQGLRIELEVGGADGNMAFNRGTKPDETAAPPMTGIGAPDERECSSKERMARIDHPHRLFRGHHEIHWGSKLVEV